MAYLLTNQDPNGLSAEALEPITVASLADFTEAVRAAKASSEPRWLLDTSDGSICRFNQPAKRVPPAERAPRSYEGNRAPARAPVRLTASKRTQAKSEAYPCRCRHCLSGNESLCARYGVR